MIIYISHQLVEHGALPPLCHQLADLRGDARKVVLAQPVEQPAQLAIARGVSGVHPAEGGRNVLARTTRWASRRGLGTSARFGLLALLT